MLKRSEMVSLAAKKELYAFVTFREEESVFEVLKILHNFRGRSVDSEDIGQQGQRSDEGQEEGEIY